MVDMSKGAQGKAIRRRPSIVYSAIVVVSLAMTVLGAVVAVMGVSSGGLFSASVGDAHVKTTSVGLAIMVVGALVTVVTATRKPRDIQLFSEEFSGPEGENTLDWIARAQLCVALVTIMALGASLIL
jgi:uncharacterized membrane protein YidH (DUF202 family)